MIELSGEWSPPVIKKLLANCGRVWLFSVECGEQVHYQVEREDRFWPFSLLSSAQAKFRHEVAKSGNGAIADTEEKHATANPGRPNRQWRGNQ